MKNIKAIEFRARQILREAAELAPAHAEKLHNMRLRVSTRMTNRAGYATYRKNEIALSLPFFADDENFEQELYEVVTHEAAHLLVGADYHRRQGKPHGPLFRQIHRQLGGTGKRCHDMQLADGFSHRRRAARTRIPCPKCGQPMSLGPTQLKRHKANIALGLPGYSHNRCPR